MSDDYEALREDIAEQVDAAAGLRQIIGDNPEPLQIVDGQHRLAYLADLLENTTVGELADQLPEDEWVDLPEHGVRVKKWSQQ